MREPDVEILTLPSYPYSGAVQKLEQVEREVFLGEDFQTIGGSSVDFGSDTCLTALHHVIIDAGVRQGLLWKPERYRSYAQDIFSLQPLPVMNSPLSGSTLAQIVTAAGGGAAFMATFADADAHHIILYFLMVGGTRIVLGAADGISIGLRQGLSHVLLKWMGVPTTTASLSKRTKQAVGAKAQEKEQPASAQAREQEQPARAQAREQEQPARAQAQEKKASSLFGVGSNGRA